MPITVAINRFSADTDGELNAIREFCAEFDVKAFDANHWAEGGAGTEDLARTSPRSPIPARLSSAPLYDDDMPLWDKARHIARTLYGADDIMADKKVRDQFAKFQAEGYGHFPVCMAKTQYSFSTDPALMGAPSGHEVPIREVRLSAGAEFIVAVCGDIMTMPGPAARAVGGQHPPERPGPDRRALLVSSLRSQRLAECNHCSRSSRIASNRGFARRVWTSMDLDIAEEYQKVSSAGSAVCASAACASSKGGRPRA